ncbi:hypothetical protein M8542_38415 [Amycolatopsis sp. OK19-0408]|uniref:Uncharacterized protein n=1 Tax=Amycolatopsis iheyensis TaxID=2945988 RepID=A0A9X2NKZ3_9PSEU|nr:hypothetical protein [Amycolatopsis iheyensis]MCR6488720.1 hypothetical protein [Amycolatopsis iheyensis]
MGLETFERIDWSSFVADLSAAEAARIRAAAERVEAARPPEDTGQWDWWPEHVGIDPGGKTTQLIIAGTTLTPSNNGVDWLELDLSIVREQRPRLTVSATLEVACWCDPDHGIHVVHSEEHLVGAAPALTAAIESAAAALERWAAGSRDPSVHRATAGLPNPP